MVATRKLLPLLVLLSTCAVAENIRLKNGTSIIANQVRENGDQIEYVVGTTTYTIPRWTVERIERTGTFGVSVSKPAPGAAYRDPSFAAANTATVTPSGKDGGKLHATPPSTQPIGASDAHDLRAQIINLGHVDSRALANIEGQGNSNKTAAAYFEAARYQMEHNDNESARSYLRRALTFAPDNTTLLGWYVVLLMEAGQYADAVGSAEHAARLAPSNADTQRLVGLAYYNAGKVNEAIRAWERAQRIQPQEIVQQYIAKAQRELKVEEGFAELQSPHFTLRYEGRQPGFTLRSDLLRTLERQYTELSREFGFAPQSNITVFLYTEKQFFDVTEAPAWAGGLNDGRLRIPVGDVSGMTPRLEHVLKHELSHSFVHSASLPRAAVRAGWTKALPR